jgi:hypothetical protein
MRKFFTPKPVPAPVQTAVLPADIDPVEMPVSDSDLQSIAELAGYESDETEDGLLECNDDENSDVVAAETSSAIQSEASARLPGTAPPLKRRKLDVSCLEQRKAKQDERMKELTEALGDIHCLLVSKKTKFASGPNGLQARRARAMESHLRLVIKNGQGWAQAAKQAAETYGFAANWGGRQLRRWNQQWVKHRTLPVSFQGRHAKIESLLNEPAIAAELRLYLRSNKWAMNPKKLTQFTKNQLLPAVADQYLKQIVHKEMPAGLKKYMEVELFPRIHLRVGRGVSLSTARRWLHHEGFRYISYRKGLYFDGHDRPDVLKYRNEHFLPTMAALQHRLIRYVVGDVDKVLTDPQRNFVERILVLVAHDEMASQSNDSHDKSWVLGDEHQLRKKGPGRGLHQSDGICSTVGWLQEGSQMLEYGKNYDGYWNGELFVKQVCFPVPDRGILIENTPAA